jgi:hypothetical protein
MERILQIAHHVLWENPYIVPFLNNHFWGQSRKQSQNHVGAGFGTSICLLFSQSLTQFQLQASYGRLFHASTAPAEPYKCARIHLLRRCMSTRALSQSRHDQEVRIPQSVRIIMKNTDFTPQIPSAVSKSRLYMYLGWTSVHAPGTPMRTVAIEASTLKHHG